MHVATSSVFCIVASWNIDTHLYLEWSKVDTGKYHMKKIKSWTYSIIIMMMVITQNLTLYWADHENTKETNAF